MPQSEVHISAEEPTACIAALRLPTYSAYSRASGAALVDGS